MVFTESTLVLNSTAVSASGLNHRCASKKSVSGNLIGTLRIQILLGNGVNGCHVLDAPGARLVGVAGKPRGFIVAHCKKIRRRAVKLHFHVLST